MNRFRRRFLGVSLVIASAGVVAVARAQRDANLIYLPRVDRTSSNFPSANAASELEFARLLNAERARRGLSILTVDPQLTQAARRHSIDLATHNFFSHTGSDGSTAYQRIAEAGYLGPCNGEILVGRWSDDPAASLAAFLNSPPHKATMLLDTTTDMGAGLAYNPTATRYLLTVDFGKHA